MGRDRGALIVSSLIIPGIPDFRAVAFRFHELSLHATGTLRILAALEFAGGATGEIGGVAHPLQLLGQ